MTATRTKRVYGVGQLPGGLHVVGYSDGSRELVLDRGTVDRMVADDGCRVCWDEFTDGAHVRRYRIEATP